MKATCSFGPATIGIRGHFQYRIIQFLYETILKFESPTINPTKPGYFRNLE